MHLPFTSSNIKPPISRRQRVFPTPRAATGSLQIDHATMATLKPPMTRSSSTDSSALSNIIVAAIDEDASSADHVSASTPPTSLAESGADSAKSSKLQALDRVVEESAEGASSLRRPKRVRSGVSTYNLKKLSDAQGLESAGTSRNVSGLTGKTLVDNAVGESTPFGEKLDQAMDMDWESPAGSATRTSPRRPQRRPSVKDRVKKAAGKMGSVLGKRGREVMEAGKRTLGMKGKEDDGIKPNKIMKQLDMGTKGVLDELDLDVEYEAPHPPPAKKARLSGKAPLHEVAQASSAAAPVPRSSAAGKKMKKWQREGLFVGQDAQHASKKLQKKRPSSSDSDATTTREPSDVKPFPPLPMFQYLDKDRDFTIPFDIYHPSWKKGDEKPKDWSQLNRNRLVGEAKDLWYQSENLPPSSCVCSFPESGDQGCDEQCLNRVMQYECNNSNCGLDSGACSNRAFSELAQRMKKAGPYDVGVEVIKTPNRGFGVRSCRTFAPGQIIMEYTGEIVSEGECQRRMREEYADKQCYYLMELERGLIIDGTRGSMARFINHSCEPNCEVRMVKVGGVPRMGVFAGEAGICTGEELTYDYNFDNFGKNRQVCHCGAQTCRGFLSKRLNAVEMKKVVREEMEKKRKAERDAAKQIEEDERRKKVKTDRGSSWRGWLAVDDPETKERLRQEKKEREEAEKGSTRAQRLAARRQPLPVKREVVEKKSVAKRRKTVALEVEALDAAAGAEEEVAVLAEHAKPANPVSQTRTASQGSKFTEQLDERPSSAYSAGTTVIKKTTEVSITETLTHSTSITAGDDESGEVDGETGLGRKKSLLKSVGQAVRNGLARAGSVNGGGKMKQSTLSFAKAN